MVIGGEGKTFFAKVILVDSGSSIGDLIGVSHKVLCCDLRPARPFRIALGGEDQFVAFYEGPPFKFSKSSKLHSNYVTCLRYNPTGELLVSGSTDKKLFVYNGKDLSTIGEV
jgi:WD40 repeat protein